MKIMIIACYAVLLLVSSASMAFWSVKLPNGREANLYDNGTWVFADSAIVVDKEVFKGTNGFYSIEFDPLVWGLVEELKNPEADLELTHVSRDAYALIIAERIPFALESLKDMALENFKIQGSDVEILKEEYKERNGQKFLAMEIKFSYMGASMIYHANYWSGEKGIIQAITYTAESIYDEHKKDFDELFSGIKITA